MTSYVDQTILRAHVKDVETLFKRLFEKHLSAKLSKCHFFKTNLTYLGHNISYSGILPSNEKIKAIEMMKRPIDISGVCRFLEMTSYYRKFIKNYANIAEPLLKRIRKKNEFSWNTQAEEAFNQLKFRLIFSPILRYSDYEKPFIIETNASDFAVGAVLTQKDDFSKEYVVAYASRTLNGIERRYST